MATFSYTPSYSASESSKPRVHRFQAGDGYENRIRFGLNTDPKSWSLTFSERTDEECAGILAFFESCAGSDSFNWSPPQRLGGNRLLWSEGFDNGIWVKLGTTVTANSTTSPDGFTTADKLVETTSSGNHFAYEGPLGLVSGVYTFSVYGKAAERSQITVRMDNSVASRLATFNLSTGTIISTTASTTSLIQNVGNGWYRCSASYTANETVINAVVAMLNTGTGSYTGDGTSGVHLWGAQLELGASPTVYKPTTTAAVGVRDSPGRYVCEEWEQTLRSANFNTIQATFRQVFEP